ncbi:hypothetical protein CC117_09915 [Parafrankia colletiae]|uniref:Uncharacterized protein n=1 Tax=Parafrankia colletiae TaxID=573497 RepID=A0A1S1RD30_9ACTN|nr:hypothetical protein [Parafrankia colletiae]MCK9904248.1 hypothetical protein [Frankia sp. Cpl3]OHV43987.1 hypothetical protein CC117_09915 [Parafrankia colletiae]
MVELRSGRQDRVLLLVVWGLTLVVLVLGALTLSPILLVWGIIGLPAAVALGYVHLRDTRRAAAQTTQGAAEQGTTPGMTEPAAATSGDETVRAARPDGGAEPGALDDGIEEESSR